MWWFSNPLRDAPEIKTLYLMAPFQQTIVCWPFFPNSNLIEVTKNKKFAKTQIRPFKLHFHTLTWVTSPAVPPLSSNPHILSCRTLMLVFISYDLQRARKAILLHL